MPLIPMVIEQTVEENGRMIFIPASLKIALFLLVRR